MINQIGSVLGRTYRKIFQRAKVFDDFLGTDDSSFRLEFLSFWLIYPIIPIYRCTAECYVVKFILLENSANFVSSELLLYTPLTVKERP